MSHITLAFILSFVQIDFSLDSDSKYHEDQEKRDCIFFKVEKMSKILKSKMAASVYKNKHIYE